MIYNLACRRDRSMLPAPHTHTCSPTCARIRSQSMRVCGRTHTYPKWCRETLCKLTKTRSNVRMKNERKNRIWNDWLSPRAHIDCTRIPLQLAKTPPTHTHKSSERARIHKHTHRSNQVELLRTKVWFIHFDLVFSLFYRFCKLSGPCRYTLARPYNERVRTKTLSLCECECVSSLAFE